jgi:hypothetical protein
MFALYNKELKTRWKKIVRSVWKKVRATEAIPENLLDSKEAPKFATKYCDFFLLMANAYCNMTKTDQKENIIASSKLFSLESSDWIVATIYLIAGVAKSWLNPHVQWYQGSDPNAGMLGFLSFHHQVLYFLMLEDLKKIVDSWHEVDGVLAFSKKLLTMTNSSQKILEEDMATSFVRKMASQVQKHSKRYLLTKHLSRSIFAEWKTGQVVAQLLKGGDKEMPSALSKSFFSKQHNQEID